MREGGLKGEKKGKKKGGAEKNTGKKKKAYPPEEGKEKIFDIHLEKEKRWKKGEEKWTPQHGRGREKNGLTTDTGRCG